MTKKLNLYLTHSTVIYHLGESMGILPLFWKDVFFSVFFRSKDQRGLKNAFDQKKVQSFLMKYAISRSFFRYI